jgi:hypothetical protein
MWGAIVSLNISEKNQPPKKVLEDWFLKQPLAMSINVSPHLASSMATFVRLPESRRGRPSNLPGE